MKINNTLYNFLVGIVVGVANIIPGVSGGTIAIGLGIFDKLIDAINNFFKHPKKHLPFLIPLGIGAVFGILAFSSIISYGLTYHSFETNMFFVGLVAGSITLILRNAKKQNFKPSYYIYTVIGFLIVLLFIILEKNGIGSSGNNSGYIKLLVSGTIASSAMVIPGISGSFMMILLGIYNVLLNALADLKTWLLNTSDTTLLFDSLKILIPLGIGIVIGIFLISKVIEILFSKFHSQTYLFILGLIFGSIFTILTSPETYVSGMNPLSIVLGIIMAILGVLLSTIFINKDKVRVA